MNLQSPMAIVYGLLYLWAIGSSSLALALAAPDMPDHSHLALWVGGAVFFFVLCALRPALIGFFYGLSPRESSLLVLLHVGAFVAPLIVISQPPFILCLIFLNVPLALMSHRPNQWRRLVLNSNLIILTVMLVYPHRLGLWERVAVLAAVAVLWVWTAVADHFATTLERAQESARGMGRTLVAMMARMTLMLTLAAAPLLTVTIALAPTPPMMAWTDRSGLSDPDAQVERQLTQRAVSPRPDIGRIIRDIALLVLMSVAGFFLIRHLRMRLRGEGGRPLILAVDQEAVGGGVIAKDGPRRRAAPPLEGDREAVVQGFESLCQSMETLRFPRKAGHTAREYLATLDDIRPGRGDVKTITRVFELARYGAGAMAAADLQDYRKSIEAIRLAGGQAFARRQSEAAARADAAPPRPADKDDGA